MKRLLLSLLLACSFAAFGQAQPIAVATGGTVTISCTGSSSATALFPQGIGQIRQVEITNNGLQNVFVEFGTSSAVTAAVASGYPYLPNQTKVQTIAPATTHIACISASGTQTVYVSIGVGQ